ncbi:MAG: hypothetical protein ACYDBT_04935 [Desulfobulbaceae bacterium]
MTQQKHSADKPQMFSLDAQSEKKMTEAYFVFLGWLLGVLSMLISELIQARKDTKQKELDILSEILQFLFSAGQLYNNILTDKSVFDKMRIEYPAKSSELEKKMYENFDNSIKEDFFPKLMFHSFQLKRLKDKSFWKDFEKIMNSFEILGKAIVEQKNEEMISSQLHNFMNLKKNFIEKCLVKTKI